MKALITGGSGFIGTHFARRLSRQSFDVTIFDKRVPCAESLNHCHFIQGDLLDLEQVKETIDGFDIVYHLAANADISKGAQDTALDLQLTTIATYNVLEAMRINAVKSLVFLSGSGVYGYTGGKSVNEESGPLLPVSLYGAAKLAAESLISAFANMFDMKALIVRPANIVGGGQTHGVLFDFLHKLKVDKKRLEILGDGNQTKSYLHVDDLCDAVALALSTDSERVHVINVSSDDLIDVNWIARTTIDFLDLTDVTITHTEGRVGWVGDVPTIKLDTTKLKRLGWIPKFGSKTAILKALEELSAQN
ncbi:MAG TPA: NAD-dependent epimerase/dehydratase family protein [Drouetiella sp.]|jgi:UDP-glucose 4-epimerase